MTMFADIALIAWIPVLLLIFTLLPPRRAVITSFIAAWCFLPVHGFDIKGLPEYNKVSATCVGILIAAVAFDGTRLSNFRPRLADLPMLFWCIAPMISNTLGGHGPYEGLSTTLQYTFEWGLPYFIGRLYITDLTSMRELGMGLFIGGLVYSVLCLYEIRMSPQLHNMVYGFFPHEQFGQARRGGGWRPNVFMNHGLAVGLFMCVCAMVGLWMSRCKSVRSVFGAPALVCAVGLMGVAVLCKSTGATALMAGGLATLFASSILKTSLPIRLMLLVPIAYITLRTVGGWKGQELIELAGMVSADRSGSIYWRLASENDCWNLVQPQVLFGFGRFEFAGMRLEGSDTAITADGMWLIALVRNGLFGVVVFYGSLLVPIYVFIRRIHPAHWGHPAAAPGVVVAVAVALFAIDNLFNAMPNPILIMASGGLVSTAKSIPAAARRARPRQGAGAARPAAHVALP